MDLGFYTLVLKRHHLEPLACNSGRATCVAYLCYSNLWYGLEWWKQVLVY